MEEQRTDVERSASIPRASVLVSGASFAGLASAYWMNGLGFKVTVVEIAEDLRKGGTPVDIKAETIDILRRMSLLDAVRSRRLPPRRIEFKNAEGGTQSVMPARQIILDSTDEEYEINRDDLLGIFYEAVADKVDVIFGRSISRLEDNADGVTASFSDGSSQVFSLVLGCDGMRSNTRRLVFGNDDQHLYFLKSYAFLKVVDKTFIERGVTEIYNDDGKMAMLNGYEGRTDIALGFYSEHELVYDYRDKAQQTRLVHERFDGVGWRVPELLREVDSGGDFYFDKVCQVRMPSWSKGRIALVGDAAYCPSPLAGMGGSMAIVGAAGIADAIRRYGDNFAKAFQEYDANLRPYVESFQEEAEAFGKTVFAPRTDVSDRAHDPLV